MQMHCLHSLTHQSERTNERTNEWMDGKTPGTLIEPLNQVKSQSQLSRKLESSLILIMQKDWRQSISKYRQLA